MKAMGSVFQAVGVRPCHLEFIRENGEGHIRQVVYDEYYIFGKEEQHD